MAFDIGNTEERHVKEMPGKTGAAVGKYRILKKGTNGDEFIQATAGSDFPFGVSGNNSENQTENAYSSGKPIKVKYDGVIFVEMAGTGVRGDRVMSDSDAKGVRHVNTDGVYVIGNATKAWTDGEIIPVIFRPYFVGDYTQS